MPSIAQAPSTEGWQLVVRRLGLTEPTLAAISADLKLPVADVRVDNLGFARWSLPAGHPVQPDRDSADAIGQRHGVDAGWTRHDARLSDYRVIAFDMDSTLITIECIDEIADFAGRKAEVAAITEAAMRGEITDYQESLRRRVALLAGLDADVLEQVWQQRLRFTPGVDRLIAAAKASGLTVLIVSGGFDFFTDRLKARFGTRDAHSNRLEIVGGKLTGQVVGPIIDAAGKAAALRALCERIGCPTSAAIAVGDGANDLKMMAVAGRSVAFHAKPVVRSQTTWAINHSGLDTLLGWLPAR